ncbi:unnamed protein product [Cylindrotheca closterium]|uniref:Uncharacterized protein n=1 Tax=Cylindrotheca closterium TaxID=2856 RepID=A0AAD2CWM1_9STRA|nr:unnamed protein product [Cylindrotheca closterium]
MASSDSFSNGRLPLLLQDITSSDLMFFDADTTFQDSTLQMAVEIYNEAQALAKDGNHRKACEEYASGLFIGRKVVQKLQEAALDENSSITAEEEEEEEDDPRLALEWLIATYLAMFQSRVALGDWNKARADAWAACNYAQYSPNGSLGGDGMDARSFQLELTVLSAMWTVCQNTNDKINEWQTLQSIQQLLKLPFPQSKVGSIGITREQVEDRLKVLKDELEAKT